MAIGTPYASQASWYGNTDSTSESVTCSAPVSEGDLVLLISSQRNTDNAAPFNNASSTGFTHIGQFEPQSNWHLLVDVLAKYVTAGEDGTTPTYTINFNWSLSDYGKVMMVTVIPGADINGITLDFDEYAGTGPLTFPADAQDLTIHFLGNDGNNIDQDTDFPSGDTGITWPSTGTWQQSGFAISGGNTTSGTWTSVNGSWGSIHISAAATGHVSDCTSITEGQELQPNSALPNIVIDITSGASNVKTVEYQLNNTTDTTRWNASTQNWDAGQDHTNSATGLNQATPYTHTFNTNLPPDIGETKNYVLKVRAADQSDVFGSYETTNFTSGTWVDASQITFTADTTSTDANAETISATGTAYSAGVSVDADPEHISGTGTAYDATTTSSGGANAETISATGTAYDATTTSSGGANAETISATGTAYGATGTVDADPETISATGTAYNPTATESGNTDAFAETVSASGAAYDVSVLVDASAETITGAAGAAYDTTGTVAPMATIANASGAGYDALVNTDSQTNAPAQTISATGTAYNASTDAGPSVDLIQVTGNHDHSTLLTGVAFAGAAAVTAVEVRADGGAWTAATNTGTNYSSWEIDPTIIPGWPTPHQLDGNNDPITMPSVLIEVRAFDGTYYSNFDSATLTPTLPPCTITLGDDRAVTGTMADASITEVRIRRTWTAGGSVDQMWNDVAWVANTGAYKVVSTDELATVWSHGSIPTWLASNDTPDPDDKDTYIVEVRARCQTNTATDSATIDTDWPTITYDSPSDGFEYTSDPETVACQVTLTDASALAATMTMRVDRAPTTGGTTEYLQTDKTTWSTSPADPEVTLSSGTGTLDVPATSGYTYNWEIRSASDEHNNTVSHLTYPGQTFSVESEPVAFDDLNIQTDLDTPVVVDVLANDIDIWPGIVVAVTIPPTSGSTQVLGSGAGSTIRYTPNASYAGPDSFTYSITNTDGGTDTGIVYLTVGLSENDVDRLLRTTTTSIINRVDLLDS